MDLSGFFENIKCAPVERDHYIGYYRITNLSGFSVSGSDDVGVLAKEGRMVAQQIGLQLSLRQISV